MDNADIQSFLETLGKRLPPSSHLVLVGGSALILLGSTRRTIDIDFVGDDIRPSKLHRSILEIAREQQIHVEPVPLERFIPLPKGSEKRNIYIGQFGNLKILWLTRTALPLANWTAASIPTSMISFFSFGRVMLH